MSEGAMAQKERGAAAGLPHGSELVSGWREARRRTGRMLVALDYDGTLLPIAPRPEAAVLPEETRRLVARLAARPDTDVAVISGRGLEDIRSRVGLEGVYYAGNHGLELSGPGLEWVHPDALRAQPAMAACAADLVAGLGGIDGVVMEDKRITLSVHYRLVRDEAEVARVRRTVLATCAGRDGLRITEGKRVLEVRPTVDWDKGRATRFLVEALGLETPTRPPVVFFGDDLTDEDAFRALRGRGDGVLVASAAELDRDTAATALVESTDEVLELLAALADP